jgi:disulfide bond formation protein DsbB
MADRALFVVWFVSVVGTLGSLFFSEVMRLPPCTLCWYQRILLYPLVIVSTVGLVTRDAGAARYAWPFVIGGLAIATYHNLVYYHLIPESLTPCTVGVSCSERQIEWLGFITIPLLSEAAFIMMVAALVVFRRHSKGSVR